MIEEEHKDLSDRLHATSGFAFIGGMLELTSSERILSVTETEITFGCLESFSRGWDCDHRLETSPVHSYYRPDLRDDATIGCLIALLGRVTQAHVSVNWSAYKRFWEVHLDFFDPRQESDTVTMPSVAEALVELFEKYDTNREGGGVTAKTPFRELALDVCGKVDAKLVAMTGWYGKVPAETMAVWVFEELTELRLEMEQLVAWIENIKEMPR